VITPFLALVNLISFGLTFAMGCPVPFTTWPCKELLFPQPHTINKIKAIILKRCRRSIPKLPDVVGKNT
jgi:hypothetical protein